ncbi:MAG TPA: hypothetical protein VG347_18415 [Verrucomicrobiae bacterium]|nr:hypothetical protein [Verrucomicrobiae bacterium]
MSGKNLQLTPLETRKQLLLIESELNRVQLVNELRDLKGEIHHLRNQFHAIGSLATSATQLATAFSEIGGAFTRRDSGEKEKSSWFSTLFNGLKTGAAIWGAVKSHLK